MFLLLLALAIAPGIAISLFIYSLNKYGKGRLSSLILSFVLGMASTLPALLIQTLVEDVRDHPYRHSILAYAWYAFIVIALSEEGSKYAVLRLYAYRLKEFKQPFDGIVYSVMIGMGFATVENIEYVRQFGLETGISRFFLAVPAHAAFAILMGYQVGWAKALSGEGETAWLKWKGLLIPVFFHGSFDFFLFLQQKNETTHYFSTGILSFGAFATFYIAVRLAFRALRMQSSFEEEQQEWDQNSNFN